MKRHKKIWIVLLFPLFLFSTLWIGMKAYAADESLLLEQLSEAAMEGNIYEVKQDGSGDFVTIQEGVVSVESGDTLLIYPGVYEENVEIMDKTVNLIGVSRDECILTANSEKYHYIPLTIGAGKVYNMTICGTKTGENNAIFYDLPDYDLSDYESIYRWQKNFPGYAIHIDQNYSYGRQLHINNCKIISSNNQCVGIGSRGENQITISDSELISNGLGGCIYFHNTQAMETAGETQFTIRNCELRNYRCPYVIAMHSMGDLNPVYLTFQNVKVSTVAYEEKSKYSDTNMNTWCEADHLDIPEMRKLLEEGGYYTSLNSELVHRYSKDDSYKLCTKIYENTSLLDSEPQLEEGITYIKMTDTSAKNMKWENEPQVKNRTRHVIAIVNADKEADQNGWCGLSNIYLTEESYGNTLMEMNYPRVVME